MFLILSVYFRYYLNLEWLKSRHLEFDFETLSSTGLDFYVCGEIFLCIISPLPWI